LLSCFFVLRDDIPERPTYDSIVVDASRVQKHIVFYEQFATAGTASESDFVRIVDIVDSPPQFTDKGIAGRSMPAGDEDTDESTYSG
jgi:hypothetical protein